MQNIKINLNLPKTRLTFNDLGINNKNNFSDILISINCWKEFDKNGNLIHYIDSNGNERWIEYNTHYYTIHSKDSNGNMYYKKYNVKGKLIGFKFYI